MGTLDFRDINAKKDLDDLRKIMLDLDLIDSIERMRHVEKIIEFCRSREKFLEERYSIRFMSEGIRSYMLGLDEAAIYYSSLSIELVLLSKLFRKMKKYCSGTMSTFSLLIRECKKQDILDESMRKIADDIRLLRDCYIHYNNWLDYGRVTALECIEFIKGFKDNRMGEKEREHTIEVVKGVFPLLQAGFPFMKEKISDSRKKFMTQREKEWQAWLLTQGMTFVDYVKVDPQDPSWRRYGRTKFDAFTSLQWGADLLRFLFPEIKS